MSWVTLGDMVQDWLFGPSYTAHIARSTNALLFFNG